MRGKVNVRPFFLQFVHGDKSIFKHGTSGTLCIDKRRKRLVLCIKPLNSRDISLCGYRLKIDFLPVNCRHVIWMCFYGCREILHGY